MDKNKKSGRTQHFYGWIIVIASMAVMATAVGIVNNCFGLLIVPACEEMGYSRAQMAGNQTMLSLGAMIMAMVTGRIINRKNIMWLMRIGAILMCVLYALFAVLRRLSLFYIIALSVGLAQGFINIVPFSILVSSWFVEKRGLALGLTFMGSGLGGMLFNAFGGWLIERIGWRHTVLVFDLILCAVILPIVFFIIHAEPANKGLSPLGGQEIKNAQTTTRSKPYKESRRNRIILCIVAFDIMIAGMGVNCIGATMTPYYTDIFGSISIGANLTSGYMASLALGKLALGSLYDRIGNMRATITVRILLVCTLLVLYAGKNILFVGIFLAISGIAAATSSVSVPFLAGQTAPESRKAVITGIFTGMQFLGSLLAPLFCGLVCSYTGTYAPAYMIVSIGIAVMLPLLILSLKATIC